MSADNDPVIQGAEPADQDREESTFPGWKAIWDNCNIPRDRVLSGTQLACAIEAHPDTSTSTSSGAKNIIQQAVKNDELAVRRSRGHKRGEDTTVTVVSGYELVEVDDDE